MAIASRVASCNNCPLRGSARFREHTESEATFIEAYKVGELGIDEGAVLFEEGADSAHIYTVLSGWAFRYKLTDDGSRQILSFALPGDLLGLQASLFGSLDHSVQALSGVRLCVFERTKFYDIFRKQSGLAYDVTWLAARQERLLDETLVNIARRSAVKRIAYLLLFLLDRAHQSGEAEGNEMILPLTQDHVADALGLSLVHTNKSLRKLVNDEFVEWQSGRIKLFRLKELQEFAGYEPSDEVKRPFI